eukprot:Gb_07020 [translate_table: standard]
MATRGSERGLSFNRLANRDNCFFLSLLTLWLDNLVAHVSSFKRSITAFRQSYTICSPTGTPILRGCPFFSTHYLGLQLMANCSSSPSFVDKKRGSNGGLDMFHSPLRVMGFFLLALKTTPLMLSNLIELLLHHPTFLGDSSGICPSDRAVLDGNPVCSQQNIVGISKLCGTQNVSKDTNGSSTDQTATCSANTCPSFYEYAPLLSPRCICAAPIEVGYRLKSPGFSSFRPYIGTFEQYLTSGLKLDLYQLSIDRYVWEPGPRLAMNLKFFPPIKINVTERELNKSEVQRVRNAFAGWKIPDSDIFGPYEWISITLDGPYKDGRKMYLRVREMYLQEVLTSL